MDQTAAILDALLRASRSGGESALERYCPQTPTPKQREFLAAEEREVLFGGAAGGAKSSALLMAALEHVDTPGYSAGLFRRTFTDLSLPGALMDRASEWLTPTDAHWDGLNRTWRFPSGASLSFGYLDGPRDHLRYQGAEFQMLGFDEVNQITGSQYLYLQSRLRRVRGMPIAPHVRCTSNPGGLPWVKERFITEIGDRRFIPSLLADNPHIDAEEYTRSLMQLDEVTRRQLLHGEWIEDTSGLVYKFRQELLADELPELPPGERWYYLVGIDYGNVDATAFVLLAFSRHCPDVYVVESEKWTDLTPSDAAKILQKWETTHKPDAMVADVGGLGKGYAEEAKQRYALPVEPAEKQNKLGYIKLMNGDMEKARLRVLPGNDDLVTEWRALPWKDDTRLQEHPDFDNHLTDAALYGWRAARHWAWTEAELAPAPGTREALVADEARRVAAKERRMQRQRRERMM